jgi:hypothetical protein
VPTHPGAADIRAQVQKQPGVRLRPRLRTPHLVEFADEHGRTIELLNVPYEALTVRSSEPAERRAAG